MTVAKCEQLMKNDSFGEESLPEGWVFAFIGHLVDITSGKYIRRSDYSQAPNKPYPVAGAGGPIGWTDKTNFKAPILTLGRVGVAGALNIYQMDCWVTDNVLVIQPKKEELFDLLSLFFRTIKWSDIHTGSSQPLITQTLVKQLEIPLSPLTEQKRIVGKVEQLLSWVKATKERLAKVSMILKRFRQSVLAAACSGRLTTDWREKNLDVEPTSELLKRILQDRKKPKKSYLNRTNEEEDIYFDIPDSWSFCFFEDICSNKPHAIKAGPFGSSLTKSCYTPSGYKIYGQEQVIRRDPNYGDYYIDKKKFLELKSCEVETGDLLISLVGTIGKVLIIPDKFEKGIINPRLVKISLHSEISPEYIAEYLSSPLVINMFKRDSHGGTMEILNLKMLKALPVPLPPVIEQHEVVRRVEALFNLADTIEKRVAAASLRTEKLTQAILAKAFCGELVPTEAELARREGRPYESASELLARIKSDEESKQASHKVRSSRVQRKTV